MKVSELPVMKSHCKSCPFKPDKNGIFQDNELADKVTSNTLFKAQQICHSTEKGKKRIAQNRCFGSYQFNLKIYKTMKLEHLIE